MSEGIIIEAQEYLTVEKEDGHKQIVDIRNLLKGHNIKEVIRFLKEYRREKERALKSLMLIDKTHRKVDQYIAALFRITMAIKTLEEGEEVTSIEQSQQRAKESGRFRQRHSGSNHGTRSGKDRSHDAKNRIPRYPTERAA